MNIQEIRARYPQYSDLSDDQLGKALHSKFYADMPYDEFAAKTGIKSSFDVEGFRAKAPPSQSTLENLGPTLIEHAPAIGSVAGGIAGTVTAGPGGGLAGTALGTSIGTSVKQIAGRLKGGEQPIAGEGGIVHEQMKNIVEQTTYDMLGNVIGAGLSKAGQAVMPKAREGAVRAQELLREKGGSLSAAQAVDSPTLNLAESFARAGAGGKGQFAKLDKGNATALQAIKSDLIEKISADPINDRVAGKLFQDAIGKGEVAHKIAASALYKDFDAKVGEVLVDTAPVQQFGRELAAELRNIGNVGKSEAGGRLIDQLGSVPKTLTFSEAHSLRSNLLATLRDLKGAASPETKAVATASMALKRVEDAMEGAATSLPGNLHQEYRAISSFYRKGKEAFNNDIIADLVVKQPERVGEALFKTGNVSEIVQAKASLRQASQFDKTVDSKDAYNRLQAGFLNARLTAKSATDKMGETTAQNLLRDLIESRTERQFQVMFSPEQRKAIHEFALTAYTALNNKPQNFGVLVSMIQAAAIVDLGAGATGSTASTKAPGADAAIILSPYVLSKVLTNPRAVSALAKGLMLPSAGAGPAVTKLTAEFVKAMSE